MAKAKNIETLPIEPLMVRADQAAALCGLSVSTWYEFMSAGRTPPSIKVGRARLWRLDVLRQWCKWSCPPIDKFLAMQQGVLNKEGT